METILLTVQKARELYDFDYNINESQFNQFVLRVQRNSLKPLLGDDLYNDLTADTPTIDYSALLDPYIYNFLSASLAAKYIVEGNLFHTNRGNYQFDNNTTEKAEKWQLEQISRNYQKEQADYRNDIINFLDENSSTYTLWPKQAEENEGISFIIV